MSVHIISSDNHLQCVAHKDAIKCKTLVHAMANSNGHNGYPVPFDLETTVLFFLLLNSRKLSLLDDMTAEQRALVLTMANWIDCQLVVSMVAWYDAREMLKKHHSL